MMKDAECSECGIILYYGEDDMGEDDEKPLCADCQIAEAELSEYMFDNEFEMVKRFAGYRR